MGVEDCGRWLRVELLFLLAGRGRGGRGGDEWWTRGGGTGGVKGDGASRKKGCQKADSGERAIKSR